LGNPSYNYLNSKDIKVNGIVLSGKYQILLDNGEPVQIEGPIDNKEYLLKIAQLIKNKYIT